MSAMYISPVSVCTPSERLFFPLKQLKRPSAFSNMRLKSYHMQQRSTTETLWQNLRCPSLCSLKSEISYLTGRHSMEKRSKPHRFQSCLMFCLKERVRMEQRRPAADTQPDSTERRLRELTLKWFTETQAPIILHEGNFPAWFEGLISRKDAEEHLKDKQLGCFLIRLSDKATGYILSYKGRDRCRHFVINQNKEGQFIVSGDTEMHDTLTSLIEFYKTSPIEPFGEYLTLSCFETSTNELYDVVQFEPKGKPGINVKTARNMCDQRAEKNPSQSQQPPAIPSRSNRTTQAVPPVPKRSIPQKMNSLEEKNSSEGNVLYAQLEQPKDKYPEPKMEGRDPRWSGHQRVRALWSPAPGQGTVYSELNLSDCRSRSLPLLDDDTKGEHSYKLNTPSPSPPQLFPNLQKENARKVLGQTLPGYSHSLDKLSDHSFYQLAGQPVNPRDTKQATTIKPQQTCDVTYAEVPREPIPNRFLTEENTYEQIPEPRQTPSSKGLTSKGNTHKMLEDFKSKPTESIWGSKGEKWKWLLPENWKK
ncbi:SH2 domain-containing protein 2A-like [Hoplias malabaricus]|uniref:SH2 domain-containing protein 2A-like n=1 Tax=Hoplias malabaricus TaxID=27720 RepID=UPI0034634225